MPSLLENTRNCLPSSQLWHWVFQLLAVLQDAGISLAADSHVLHMHRSFAHHFFRHPASGHSVTALLPPWQSSVRPMDIALFFHNRSQLLAQWKQLDFTLWQPFGRLGAWFQVGLVSGPLLLLWRFIARVMAPSCFWSRSLTMLFCVWCF